MEDESVSVRNIARIDGPNEARKRGESEMGNHEVEKAMPRDNVLKCCVSVTLFTVVTITTHTSLVFFFYPLAF